MVEKVKGSPYWRARFTVDGKEIRRSTRTKDLALAEKIESSMKAEMMAVSGETRLKRSLNKILSVDPEWSSFVDNQITDKKSYFWNMYAGMKSRARKKGFGECMSSTDLESLYRASNGKCTVSGLPFRNGKADGHRAGPWQPSIDRIDCTKGYTLANCRIVCYCVNLAMNQFGEDALYAMCAAVHIKQVESYIHDTLGKI